MSFDYSAPAELFLAKPAKGSRTKYRRFATAAEAIRYAVEDLRTPQSSARGCKSETSASTAPKSSACTKRRLSVAQAPVTARHSPVREDTMAPFSGRLQRTRGATDFQKGAKAELGLNPGASSERVEIPRP